ncbi:MAG: hypothetical protein KIT18_07965 [Burkholderiales bacterium]|nr:hypothetical protein [Burkholderiales bacterium]
MRQLEKIVVHRPQIPLVRPYRLALGTVRHYGTLIVELADRDGRRGLRVATGLTGYTDETIEDNRHTAREFAAEQPACLA